MANITFNHITHGTIPPEINQQVSIGLSHDESQRIGDASELDEVAAILGDVAGAGIYSPQVGAAVFDLRNDIKNRDHGDGVRVVLTYWIAPYIGRRDRDVQTEQPTASG